MDGQSVSYVSYFLSSPYKEVSHLLSLTVLRNIAATCVGIKVSNNALTYPVSQQILELIFEGRNHDVLGYVL